MSSTENATRCIPISLGRVGFVSTAVVFVSACVLLGWAQVDELDFMGSAGQFVVSGVAIIALVVAGLLVRQPLLAPTDSDPPAPILVAGTAFAVTSGYWLSTELPVDGAGAVWAQVAAFVVAGGVSVVMVLRWSRRRWVRQRSI